VFVVVRYFVPDVGMKVKLLRLKSLQVKLLQYSAKIATKSMYKDMSHLSDEARYSEASQFSITKICHA